MFHRVIRYARSLFPSARPYQAPHHAKKFTFAVSRLYIAPAILIMDLGPLGETVKLCRGRREKVFRFYAGALPLGY